MNSVITKCVHVLLALFILAAAVAPACAGSANCSMPCCRHPAQPVSQPWDAVHSKPCCTQPADAPAGIGSGCRFVQHNLALPSAGDTGPVLSAGVGAVAPENPIMWSGPMPSVRCIDSSPPDTPLYLRLRTLLI